MIYPVRLSMHSPPKRSCAMTRTILFGISALLWGGGTWGPGRSEAATLVPAGLDLPALRYSAMAWAIPDTSSTVAGKSLLAMTGLAADGKIRTYLLHIAPGQGGQPTIVKRDSTDMPGSPGTLDIPGVIFGQIDWADYDRDGLLDLAIAGRSGGVEDTLFATTTIALVYRQRADGSFVIPSDFPTDFGVDSCIIRWVDYNVDGFVDLFISGRRRTFATVGGKPVVRGESRLFVLKNVSPDGVRHQFVLDRGLESRVDQIVPVHGGDARWYDVNGNGAPDLAICGLNVSQLQGGQVTRDTLTDLYVNDPPGVLTRSFLTQIRPKHGGGIALEDYNQDGRYDLAVSGRDKGTGAIRLEVWENIGVGKFRQENIELDQRYAVKGRLQWGDLNNDGWLDLVSLGDSTGGNGGIMYYLNGRDNTFSPLSFTTPPPPLRDGTFVIGHLDTDGTLDLIASGYNTATGNIEAHAWTMQGMPANDPPARPTIDFPIVAGDRVVFAWGEVSDLTGGGTIRDDRMVSYELLMYYGTTAAKVFTAPARILRGQQGRTLTYTLYRTLAPHPGMPVFVRAVDVSGVTSAWSASKSLRVQDFVSSFENVVPLRSGGATWVDVDNSGAPDLVVNGYDQGSNETNRLYLNAGRTLMPDTAYALPGFYLGSQAWGDVDGDGLIDVLLTGSETDQKRITKLYLNESGRSSRRFRTGAYVFEELTGSRAAMGDVDNDGDVDFVVTGVSGAKLKTFLALNTGVLQGGAPGFDTTSLDLPLNSGTTGLKDGWISLYDYDQDGLVDLTIQGTIDTVVQDWDWYCPKGCPDDDYMAGFLEIYRNEGNLKFTRAYGWPRNRTVPVSSIAGGDTALDQLANGEHAWADIDNDGDPDLIAVGFSRVCTEFTQVSHRWDASALRIYENLGNGRLAMKKGYPGLWYASLAVADVDNDGYVDILLTGNDDHDLAPVSPDYQVGDPRVYYYRNDGNHSGTFSVQTILLFDQNLGAGSGAVRLGDFDGDGDLDAFILGESITPGGKVVPVSTLYTNTNSSQLVNRQSRAPTALTAHVNTTPRVSLTWEESFDPDVRQDAHTYSLRIGTAPGSHNVRPGTEPTGPGRLGYRGRADIRDLPDGQYYWSVRAVDHAWQRSDWAPEQSYIIDTTPPKVARLRGDTLSVGADQIINVVIAFYDSLTGVNEASPNMSVKLSILGRAPMTVRPDPQGWQPGSVWVGQVSVPPGTFLAEPVTVHISGVRDNQPTQNPLVTGNLMPDTSITTRLVSSISERITSAGGGRLSNSSRTITLYVPPGGVDQDVRVSLYEPDPAALPSGPGAPAGVAVEFEAQPTIAAFQTPAILTMYFGAAAKRAGVRQNTDVRVFRLDGTQWRYVGGNPHADTVSVPIRELGTYALFAATGDVTLATLSDLDATPRVFSPGSPQGFSDHTEIDFTVATADVGNAAVVKIYNHAGRLVRELAPEIVAGANAVSWDGLDEGNSVVPSGLYIVAVSVGGIQETKTVVVLNKYARP